MKALLSVLLLRFTVRGIIEMLLLLRPACCAGTGVHMSASLPSPHAHYNDL